MITNDPNQKEATLTIFGKVERFVKISPPNVWLGGSEGKPIKRVVTIIPEKKYPFKIVNSKAKVGRNIKFQIKEVNESENLQYELIVENTKKLKGNYYDQIQLETDSKIKPLITIHVNGRITAAN